MVSMGNMCSRRSGKVFPLWPTFKAKTLPTRCNISHFESLRAGSKARKTRAPRVNAVLPALHSGLDLPLHNRMNKGALMAKTATLHTIEPHARPPASIEARVQNAISRIAQSDCPVLIVGEYGVGKRSVAEQIHAQSNRPRRLFEEIQCSDTNEQELSSALSNQGTVYLAEVGDLSL